MIRTFCTGLFDDGRFIVVISKYDRCFEPKRRKSQRGRERVVTSQSLQQITQSFIHSSIGVKPPFDIAVPVSAEWAESAYELRDDPNNEELRQSVNQSLSRHREQQPQGQGEPEMLSLNMATGLERISGISQLEERCNDCILTVQ